MEKQMMLHKIEKTLIFKQKMLQQAKKRSEKLKQFYDDIFSRMRKVEQDLNCLRIDIEKKMQKAAQNKCCSQSDQNICWKKEVMKKFREKLLGERNILKQQQKQLQIRYLALENVSDQCKKLVNESYEGIFSTLGSGNSSIISGNKQQKIFSSSMMSSGIKKLPT